MSDDIPATIKQWQETLATSFSLLRTDAAKQLLADVEQALLGKDAEIARLRAENAALRADLAMAREREGATGLEYRGG